MNKVEGENIQERTVEAFAERPMIVFLGCIPFVIRPITLTQIWEIGNIVKDMIPIEKEKVENIISDVAAVLSYSKEGINIANIIVLFMFRSRWMRWLFGNYVKKRLTVKKHKKIQNFMARSMDPAFFLSTIIFLRGITELTKPTNIAEAIVPGPQLVE
jgi:hypothetical protein|nr:MAG TPA: hypothetical protein [Caudoviricetes sp.]